MKKIDRDKLTSHDISTQVFAFKERTYPADSLTPSRLAFALKDADTGDVSAQAEIFADMMWKDPDLGAALSMRAAKVAGLDYSVTPGDDSPLARKAAEATVTMLDEYLTNFRAGLKLLLNAIGQGFSVAEISWQYRDGMIWAVELLSLEQRFFTFRYRDNPADLAPRLQREPRMLTQLQPKEGEPLLPYKYIVHKYTGLSGVTPRDGLVKQCAYLYLFKNYDLKDWITFLDRYGVPMRIGKYNSSASETAVDVLRRAVIGLGSDAAALISDATTIEILENRTNSTDMFERLQEHLAKKIDKIVLGHSAAAEATPGKLGNDTQATNTMQLLKANDARELEQTLRQQLLEPFTVMNFGIECSVPKIIFRTDPTEDVEKKALVIATLANAGFGDIPLSYLHDTFGIPVPKGGEATLGDIRRGDK